MCGHTVNLRKGGARMRSVLTFALTLVVCLALAATALCGPFEQGTKELSGSAAWATASYSYEDEDLGSETALRLAPGFGYFITDSTEFRLQLPVTFSSYDWDFWRADYSETTWGPQFAILYHFAGSESFVPFVGAGVGMSLASNSEDDEFETVFILPSAHAGFRSFFTESACLTTELLYQHQNNALYIEDVSANVFGLTVGIGVFF
jgi:opacity protein-like surface antigen